MGRDVDPEMLKNLDLLLDYESVEQEENWVALQNWEENQSAEEVAAEAAAEEELVSEDEDNGGKEEGKKDDDK